MRDVFKYLIVSLAIVIAAGTIYYEYEQERPCATPVRYTIGAVAPQFGISTTSLLADAEFSANIWNTAAGKIVLEYDPSGNVPINLVYDSRQESAQLGAKLADEQAVNAEASTNIDTLKAEYDSQLQSYNQEVAGVNARGGATPAEIGMLDSEKEQLQSLQDTLNAQIAAYNSAVDAFNVEIKSFNQTAGTTFEEGEYVQDSGGKRINIFEYASNTQLERVLAHEMGHAIGLGHNTNPKSIMYAQNESGNLVPTADDLAALKALCSSN